MTSCTVFSVINTWNQFVSKVVAVDML